MKEAYKDWINGFTDNGFGFCKERTKQMVEAFPELKRIRGHYYDILWGERTHWWCVDPEGDTVDPTAQQFPTKGRGVYIPWEEGAEEPTGKCPNCGELCYGGTTCCSEQCHKAYVAYCMGS